MQTLRKALNVLRKLADAGAPMGVTELSHATGIDKAIVHRALRTLVDETLVVQDPATRKYQLGPGLLHLAGVHLAQLRPLEIAKPHLLTLWRETDETVHLCVRDGLEVMLVQVYESGQGVRVSSHLGERAPLHGTAGGKVFLAHDPALVERLLAAGLAPRQPATITDPDRLGAELEDVRKRGWAADIEESDPDYCAIAAPVAGYDSPCVAAVAVAMPSRRYRARDVETLAAPLRACAAAISAELGAERA